MLPSAQVEQDLLLPGVTVIKLIISIVLLAAITVILLGLYGVPPFCWLSKDWRKP